MVGMVGIEPTIFSLSEKRSTIEPHAHKVILTIYPSNFTRKLEG